MAVPNQEVGNKHVPDAATFLFDFAPSDDSEQSGYPSSLLLPGKYQLSKSIVHEIKFGDIAVNVVK